MFTPKYTITEHLLANITRINKLVFELNARRFPNIVSLEFQRNAEAVSAYASTSIEGNPLPLTEVKKILKSKPEYIKDSEKEVLNYNRALQELNERINKDNLSLKLDIILHIHKQVIEGLLPELRVGKLRSEPVFVNNPKTGQPIYLPPDAQDIAPLINDLISFIHSNKNKINPLVLAGIFHKQMVIIHPFIDGNGRTTRLITKLLLAEMGLDTFNLFSFENYYNNNVTRYFQMVGLLGNYYDIVENIDFTPWLEYFTEGIIDELLRVSKLLPTFSVNPESELKPYHLQMLEAIKAKGFTTDRDYSKLTDRAKATRTLDFKKLIDLGLITRKGKGKATHYVLKEK